MMITSDEIEWAVKQAADVLTEMYPRWEQEIHLEDLVMSDSVSCILGQLGRRRAKEYNEMFAEVSDRVEDSEILLAFDIDIGGSWDGPRLDAWAHLRNTWVSLLESR